MSDRDTLPASDSAGFLPALERWVPGFGVIARYQRQDALRDLGAGLVLSGLLVPQGMAYAMLAGLPPITGLYTTVAVLVAYFLFGPSRILVLGPDSSLGPIIALTVLPLAFGVEDRAVVLASMLSVFVGVIAVVLGILRLGFIADLLSKPVRVGYLAGLAVTILASQLPRLLGIRVQGRETLDVLAGVLDRLPRAQPVSVIMGLVVIATIIVVGRVYPKAPAVLIAALGATLCTWWFDLSGRGVAVVGVLPQGIPSLQWPSVALRDVATLLVAAGGIALVSLADSVSTAAAFGAKRGEAVHADRELIAVGIADILAGIVHGFPVSASGSRTAVAERAGAATQVTGLVAATAVVALLVFAPGATSFLPQPALAGIVVVAAFSLIDAREFFTLARVRRSEFIQALVAACGVIVLGVLNGLALAVVVSVLNFFRRAWWPHDAVLGDALGIPGFHDIAFHPDARVDPGLIIYRFDAPLFFANARAFHDRVLELVENAADEVRWVVVAADPITDIEATAAEMLRDLDLELNARGIHFVFAGMKDPVRARVRAYDLEREIPPESFYPTVHAAVKAYRSQVLGKHPDP